MSDAARLVTAEELERLPDDDRRYELVEGRVICMSPVGFQHGRIVMQFGSLLHQHVQPRKLGVVMTEVGFQTGIESGHRSRARYRLHPAGSDSAVRAARFLERSGGLGGRGPLA